MKVHELMKVLAECDPDEQVHVAVELGNVDSVSFHPIEEVEGCGIGCSHGSGVEIVVYDADEVFCGPPELAAVLLGGDGGSSGDDSAA